jgi:hypothetical protein
MRPLNFILALGIGLGLAACGERPQTASHRKSDTHAYEGPAGAYTAAGWKAGDATSWEQQMRSRSQGQNEYSRTAPQAPAP